MADDPIDQEYRYWAFISYSHTDEAWARWLHRGLETYYVPKKLVGKMGREGMQIPPRAAPVFLDRDELPGSAKLTDNIVEALQKSRYLIVICSPNAVASQWVEQEIRIYKAMGREDRVLCLIIDGEPNADTKPSLGLKECFPTAARFIVDKDRHITTIPTEPIAADARKGKDGKRHALLKLLAGILGVQFDDLRQREQERRNRRRQWLVAAMIIVTVTLSAASYQFYLERNIAVQAERAADYARERTKESLVAETRAKEAADAATAEERIAKEKETVAHQQAEVARQAADAARNEAVVAKNEAVGARNEALGARNEAIASEQKLRRILSTSDLTAATRLVDENNQPKALAYLSRALRFDPDNSAVVARVISLLSERNWPLPADPLLHADPVKRVQFSPDGRLLATLSANSVRGWDVSNHELLFELKHDQPINFVEFSPDGKLAATGSADHTVQLWEMPTGKKIGYPLPHDSSVAAGSFSPDGKLLVTGTLDHFLCVWDVATGQQTMRPIHCESAVHALTFHPYTNQVLVVSKDSAQIWDLRNRIPTCPPMSHAGGVSFAAFSPTGKYVATAAGDRTARIWDATTGQPTSEPLKHDNWVNTVQFSPDESWIVTASSDNTARVWEVPRGKAVATFHQEAELQTARFSPNARWVVTACTDGTALLWDVLTGKPLMEPLKHSGAVNDVVFSPDGKSVATASSDHTAKIWNIVSSKPVFEPLRHSQTVNIGIFSPDGKWIATGSDDRSARVWEVASGRPITEPLSHGGSVISLAFSADGKRLITGSQDGAARIWDIKTRELLCPPLRHGGWVRSICLSPDDKWLATASDDRTARIWNATNGEPITPPLSHTGEVKSAAFSSDGQWLLTTSSERTAHLWNAATGKLISEIPSHPSAEVRCAALSPDGAWTAVGFGDSTAHIYNSTTGEPIGPPLLHEAPVNMIAFVPGSSPTQKWILTVADKFARIWDAATGKAITEPIKHDAPIQAVNLSSDGVFFSTVCQNTARVWEVASGRAVTDPLVHSRPIRDARFSPDGTLLVTCSEDQSVRIWFLTVHGRAPAWLSDLADAVSGYRLDEGGATQLIRDPWQKLSRTRPFLAEAAADPYVVWGQWYSLGDRSTRSMWAFGEKPVSDYVQNRIAEGTDASLSEALQIQPNSGPALARLGVNSIYPAQAEFFTRLAETYEPQNSDVLWVRASILHEQTNFPAALAVMKRALALDPRNIHNFGPDGAGFTYDNRGGVASQGWLPKGWVDQSTAAPMKVDYTRLADRPAADTTAVEMKVVTSGASFAQLSGPHLICQKGVRCAIVGWTRSASKSDINLALTQIVEPHKNYFEQTVHPSLEWKPFKYEFNPLQDIGAELIIREPGGADVQLAGVTVRQE